MVKEKETERGRRQRRRRRGLADPEAEVVSSRGGEDRGVAVLAVGNLGGHKTHLYNVHCAVHFTSTLYTVHWTIHFTK